MNWLFYRTDRFRMVDRMQPDDTPHAAALTATHHHRISSLQPDDAIDVLVAPRRLRTPFGCFP
jgi:hypothetical protein